MGLGRLELGTLGPWLVDVSELQQFRQTSLADLAQGLYPVKALAAQLAGEVHRPDVPQGTRIDIYFPLPTSALARDEVADASDSEPNPL